MERTNNNINITINQTEKQILTKQFEKMFIKADHETECVTMYDSRNIVRDYSVLYKLYCLICH